MNTPIPHEGVGIWCGLVGHDPAGLLVGQGTTWQGMVLIPQAAGVLGNGAIEASSTNDLATDPETSLATGQW